MNPRRLQSATMVSSLSSVARRRKRRLMYGAPAPVALPLHSHADLRVPLPRTHLEVIQSMSDSPRSRPARSAAPGRAGLPPGGGAFPRSGFYSTDYAAKAKAGAAKDSEQSGDSGASGGESSSSSSSSDAKSSSRRRRGKAKSGTRVLTNPASTRPRRADRCRSAS